MVNWIRDGFARAWQRKGSVLVLYLLATIPALAWALTAAPSLGEVLNFRPEAAEILGSGRWLTLSELGANDVLELSLGALPVLLLLAWLAQVAAAAGYVTGLLRGAGAPSLTFGEGVQRFTGRFLRGSLAFFLCLAGVLVLCGLVMAAGKRGADAARNEVWGLWAALGALVFGLTLFVPLDLAYDLSRISAVAHDGRQTFRGFFRSLRWVVARPGRLLPFYLVLVILLAVVVAVYGLARAPWSPVTVAGIAGLFLAQQIFVLLKAYLKISTWGAEAACYEELAAPDWCRGVKLPPEPLPAPELEPEPRLLQDEQEDATAAGELAELWEDEEVSELAPAALAPAASARPGQEIWDSAFGTAPQEEEPAPDGREDEPPR